MVAVSERQYLTPQDYLFWEEKQSIKYEYVDGEVFAMTGGTIPHNDLAVNLTTALKNHLRGKGCKVSMADAKVGISESGLFHYPDVMVTCDEIDRRAIQVIYHPCLIVEVLSPSTEAKDRGKKFRNYRRISTLKEYMLISSEQKVIECYRLKEKGVWELYNYTEGDEFELKSVDFRSFIELIYEDVLLEGVEEDEE